jgi:hypothetical protein
MQANSSMLSWIKRQCMLQSENLKNEQQEINTINHSSSNFLFFQLNMSFVRR